MTLTLTPEQEKFVTEQLKSGHYGSAGDVVADALGMLQTQETFIRDNTEELREKIAVGLNQLNRGESLDGREVISQLIGKHRRRLKAKK